MKHMMALLTLLLFIGARLAAIGQEGPFGISMGAKPSDYGCEQTSSDTMYICTDVPKEHPDLSLYIVYYLPETGIAAVQAFGDKKKDDNHGRKVRQEIDQIANQISLKYGEWSEHIDYIDPGSLWDEQKHWARSVRTGDRSYSYVWRLHESNHPSNVVAIGIDAGANEYGTSSGLGIFFSNYSRFQELENSRNADVFDA